MQWLIVPVIGPTKQQSEDTLQLACLLEALSSRVMVSQSADLHV